MASKALTDKLHPDNFTAMSGQMAAIVGYILGEEFTSPSIAEMIVTPDGFVVARQTGDPGCNEVVSPFSLLQENWAKLLDTAELTEQERLEANALFEAQIGKEGAVAKKEPPPSAPPPNYHPPTSKN